MLIENSTFPFSSSVENESMVLERVVSSARSITFHFMLDSAKSLIYNYNKQQWA